MQQKQAEREREKKTGREKGNEFRVRTRKTDRGRLISKPCKEKCKSTVRFFVQVALLFTSLPKGAMEQTMFKA